MQVELTLYCQKIRHTNHTEDLDGPLRLSWQSDRQLATIKPPSIANIPARLQAHLSLEHLEHPSSL